MRFVPLRCMFLETLSLVLVTTLMAAPTLADETFQTQTDHIKAQLQKEKEKLLDAEVQKRGVLGALYDINKELERIEGDMDSVEDQLKNQRKVIESYAQLIVRMQDEVDAEREKLRGRLRALYKMGLKGYTQVLLSSQTSSEFSRNMKFIKIIAEHDGDLIRNYTNNVQLLAHQQNKMRRQVKVFAQFQADLRQQRRQYDSQKARQTVLLQKIDNDRELHMQALEEWRDAGRKLEEKMVALGIQTEVSPTFIHEAFFEKKGKLTPPVNGAILQKYGIMINKRFDTKIFHKGLFFAAQPKETVSAIFEGRVAFSGWIDGYGETIIIDHGDHYYSLYAHNSLLEKKVGEKVDTAEPIALSGDTGSLRGPGLYFEIRHFSESVDPLPWLKVDKTRLTREEKNEKARPI